MISLSDKDSSLVLFTLERQQNVVVSSLALDLTFLALGSGSHSYQLCNLGQFASPLCASAYSNKNWMAI